MLPKLGLFVFGCGLLVWFVFSDLVQSRQSTMKCVALE